MTERIRGDALVVLMLSRCVACGFYTDPVMELNRAMPPALYNVNTESFPASGASHPSSESERAPMVQPEAPMPTEALSSP